MSHTEEIPGPQPEGIPVDTVEHGLAMNPIRLSEDPIEHDARGQKVLAALVKPFNIMEVPLLAQGPNGKGPRLKTRTRELASGTRVTVHWGVTENGLVTLADGKISNKDGVERVGVALAQQNTKNRYSVAYGTTVKAKDLAQKPDDINQFVTEFLERVKDLLGDDVTPEATLVTKALRRRPKRKAK